MAGAVETCSWVSLFLQGSESNVRHCWLGPAKCGETCSWVLFWRGEAGLAGPAAWLQNISPNLCVGFLFLILYPGTLPRPPPPAPPPSHNLSPTTLSHTTCYPQLSHTTCHTQLCHPQLCHTQLVTHNLSPTTLSHTTCHTQLVTHNFVTHNLSPTTLSPTTLSHTTCHPQLCHTSSCVLRGRRGTWRHVPLFHVAGMALGDIYLRFTWQAWHLRHWAGSGGALGLGLVAGDAAALCAASVALGDVCLRFTWPGWHLATATCVSRGRRGTYGTGLALVARLGWD